MNRIWIVLGVILACGAVGLAWSEDGVRAAEKKKEKTPMDHLAWMEGTWKGPFNGGTWESRYSSPEGGMILSMSKEITRGKVEMFEYERFTWDGTTVVLVPSPSGEASVEFELVDFDPKVKKARFVNEEHDFPNELIYARIDDRLVIDVFAGKGEEKHGFQLDLKLVE